jgi:prolyl-tRNA synthetase
MNLPPTSWSKEFKQHLEAAEVMSFEYDVRGSRVYLPYGWKIRNRIIETAARDLVGIGYEEIHLPNLISSASMEILDEIFPLSNKYYRVNEDLFLAATHEAVFFSFLNRYLPRHAGADALRLYHIGPVFRRPKSSSAGPLTLGERASFMEAYAVLREPAALSSEVDLAVQWAGNLINTLALPSLNVRRPLVGNHPISDMTISFETILPHGRTFASAMIYWQNKIFLERFLGEKATSYNSLHFGITDNIIMNYFAALGDSNGLCLQSQFAPHQVIILYASENGELPSEGLRILNAMTRMDLRVTAMPTSRGKIFRQVHAMHRRGVPVIIVIIEEDLWRGNLLAFPRLLPSVTVSYDSPHTILELLESNDKQIRLASDAVRRAAVIPALSPEEVASIVRDGKIASFFLADDETSARSLMRQMPVGEVLGWEHNQGGNIAGQDMKGQDILDAGKTGKLCYASRRV